MPGEVRVDGGQVERLREQRGWSQSDLARAAGVDQSVVSRIEGNAAKNPRLESVVAIASAFGVPVESLLLGGAPVEPIALLRQAVELLEARRAFDVMAEQPDGWPSEREEEIRSRLERLVNESPKLADIRLDETTRRSRKLTVEELLSLIEDELRED